MTYGQPAPPGPPAAGWYPDPSGAFAHRYWDGATWTGYVDVDGRTMWSPPGAVGAPGPGPIAGPRLRGTEGLASALGILLGVDTISDIFRTTANVTGWLAVGSIVGRAGK